MFRLNIFLVFSLLICLLIGNVMSQKFCPCAATADLTYVCGSDGNTYDNAAVLRCHAQCEDPSLTLRHLGRC